MAILKAFRGIRPPVDIVEELACRPYDVLNSEEAREEANPHSLLHITKPEIDFDPGTDIHIHAVYDKAKENFASFQEKGYLEQDSEEYLYIYAQTMDGRRQYGLVGCAGVEDYMNGIIKKHELTRPDKEEDRMSFLLTPPFPKLTKSSRASWRARTLNMISQALMASATISG
jgi:uncharacterized protein (DUF1015 family)